MSPRSRSFSITIFSIPLACDWSLDASWFLSVALSCAAWAIQDESHDSWTKRTDGWRQEACPGASDYKPWVSHAGAAERWAAPGSPAPSSSSGPRSLAAPAPPPSSSARWSSPAQGRFFRFVRPAPTVTRGGKKETRILYNLSHVVKTVIISSWLQCKWKKTHFGTCSFLKIINATVTLLHYTVLLLIIFL